MTLHTIAHLGARHSEGRGRVRAADRGRSRDVQRDLRTVAQLTRMIMTFRACRNRATSRKGAPARPRFDGRSQTEGSAKHVPNTMRARASSEPGFDRCRTPARSV